MEIIARIKTSLAGFAQPFAAAMVVLVLFIPSAPVAQAAGSATLALTPASGSYDNGTTLNLSIYENGLDAINAVEAVLVYDASKLQFVGDNTSAGAFDINVPHTNNSGKVEISVAKTGGPVTGNQLVATVSFTVLVGSGSTAITFDSSSQVVRQSDAVNVWDGNTAGGTYSLTGAVNPAPPPPPTTTPSSSGGTAKSPTSSTTASNSSIPSPTTSQPTSTTSATADYFVAVTILDGTGKPIAGALVTAGAITSKSDAYGVAEFRSLPAGTYNLTVVTGGKTIHKTITVVANGAPLTVQVFKIKVAASFFANQWYLYLIALLLIMLLIGGGGVIKRKMTARGQRLTLESHDNSTTTPPAASTVTTNPTASAPVVPTSGAQMFYPDPTANLDTTSAQPPQETPPDA